MTDLRERLQGIRTFPSLVKFLREELDWPIDSTADFEELTFDYTPDELGIDPASAARIDEIKRLRPLTSNQPWGIFFVKFEPKQLPVVALRRILNRVVVRKRATPSSAEQKKWTTDDLLFISAYGEDDERRISFAHFSRDSATPDLPTLKVLAWDDQDTGLHLDDVAKRLVEHLSWPSPERVWDDETWRARWRSAFELRHGEVVTTSKALATRLAELARAIRIRIRGVLEIESADGPVTGLMDAFREALVHDLEPDAFADMYAQTIAYGLLSARVANPGGDGSVERLPVTNPFLKELMETFLHLGTPADEPGVGIDFDELGVSEVVELLGDANMEAVVRDFGDKNPQEDPVIHFYELFLTEYDSEQKVKRGVFYTPRPVVSHIVRSVDELLRAELGLEDGLADTSTWGEMANRHVGLKIPEGVDPGRTFVQILDPATGTGTFLVEVIGVIHRRMTEKWRSEGRDETSIEALWNDYVPRHLLPRLHGYELLMAPYAIAHLKIGLKLYETGYHFGTDERARIYLTNALEPAHDFSDRLDFAIPALAHEAHAVSLIKQSERFTVVIGNPPYSVKSYNNGAWIRSLLGDFKRGLNETKLNLDDDYIKFLRFVVHLAEASGTGAFSMVTNNIFLSGVTHRQVRRYLLDSFTEVRITNLHGDTRHGEVSPVGMRNENVFDIQQGVCLWRLSRWPFAGTSTVAYADVWGSRGEKSGQLTSASPIRHERVGPTPPLYLFHPVLDKHDFEFDAWPSLTEWMPLSSNGIETHRDRLTVQFTLQELEEITKPLLSLPAETARMVLDIGDDGRDWRLDDAIESLEAMVERGERATRITYRPFDFRYTMLNAESGGFIAYPRWGVMASLVAIEDNIGLVSARLMARGGMWDACLATRYPTEKKTGDSTRSSTLFPLLIGTDAGQLSSEKTHANLSSRLLSEIRDVYAPLADPSNEHSEAREVFCYLLALLHSIAYRERYADRLKTEFPRLPVPPSGDLFFTLAQRGAELVSLYLMESPKFGRPMTRYTGPANPEVRRVGWSEDTVWLDAPAAMKGEGGETGTVGFRGVPEAVWNFHIGGYQVCHKWLKDRKGRTLSEDDIAHYQRIVIALSETIRLMQEVDEIIEEHGGWPDAFVSSQSEADA